VAVLTRAQIRWTKLRSFWANVANVAEMMSTAPGYLYSVGIGEAPFYLQATFSVWESLDEVKNFAYKSREHAEVIRKTRKEDWYSEELFARFKILKTIGSLGGINPLASLNLTHQEK
jgi:heme-degrading monooxygenase HmoA